MSARDADHDATGGHGACELRHGTNRTYHLSVWGWDGTNHLEVLVEPVGTIEQLYCPPLPVDDEADPPGEAEEGGGEHGGTAHADRGGGGGARAAQGPPAAEATALP